MEGEVAVDDTTKLGDLTDRQILELTQGVCPPPRHPSRAR